MSELWFKNDKVLTLKDKAEGAMEVSKIDTPELLPYSLRNECTTETFYKWLNSRNIPQNRMGYAAVCEDFGDSWTVNKNFASLSDQYWIKKRTEEWKKINFFTNVYCRDIGDMFFCPWMLNKNRFNNNAVGSPDLTTPGVLKKRWVQNQDKTSYLVKAGCKEAKQDPLSEVLVSVLIEQLDKIPSAGYSLCIEGVEMCCKCDNFITEKTSLVTAADIYYLEPRDDNESVFAHILKMCEKFEIPGVEEYLEWLILIDSITGNDDRNLSNIAFIYNVDEKKFEGPSPVYDCGYAYWDTKKVSDAVKSKLFGDVEENIFKKLKKECDFESLAKSRGYKKIIADYPGFSNVKKDNLIEAIEKRYNVLTKAKNLDLQNIR